MEATLRSLAAGAATFLPVLGRHTNRGTGGTASARYCYSVWMRHRIAIGRTGIEPMLDYVAELGPGDSLGIGLAAMLCGTNRYSAFDAKAHADVEGNIRVLDELAELFRMRAPVPDASEFPAIFPHLDSYEFPRTLVTDEDLERSLHPKRLEQIRRVLRGGKDEGAGVRIDYCTPWDDPAIVQPQSVGFILSQAVLEHVEDAGLVYRALGAWLRPGGLMSHTIDFQCHGLTKSWNGHWTLSDSTWRIVKGRRPYLINRLPWSTHRRLLAANGFDVVAERFAQGPPIDRSKLAPQFAGITDSDLRTSGVWVAARRSRPAS